MGGLLLRNRVVMAALGTAYGEPDGSVSPRLVAFLARRAQGGAGLVVTEATAVDASGVPFPGVPRADDDRFVPGLARLARAVRPAGAAVALQLNHAGRQMSERHAGRQPVAPSAVPCPAVRAMPRALEPAEVEALVERFAEAAARARAAGFDAVELNAGHGYLIHQFLSPLSNHRDDAWGGDPERRRRFALAVARRICDRLPGLPILVKLSAEDHQPGGLTLGDQVETARALEQAGADAVVVSSGTYATWPWLVQPALQPQGCLRPYARAMKEALGIPVVAVGRLQDPAMLGAMIRQREADLVALGRALLADPDWPLKVERGEPGRVRPCIACNQCLRRLFAPEPINCAVNPEAGREAAPPPAPAKAARRVVVLGGGAAGMSAALLARERGHAMTLVEAAPELGGRLLAAARLPHRHEMGQLARYLAGRVREAGVTVRLGCAATPALVRELAPDVLIRATGGRPAIPRVPGIDLPHVETAERCLLGLVPGGGPAVVVGDTAVACEVALALHEAGYSPALLCPVSRERLAQEAESVTRRALLADLGRRGIPAHFEAELVAVGGDAVECRVPDGGLRRLPAGRVVLAFGGEPDAAGAAAWAGAAPVVLDVGDCLTPGGVLGAVHGAEALLGAL